MKRLFTTIVLMLLPPRAKTQLDTVFGFAQTFLKRNILAIALLSLLVFDAKAQTDTSFWFAYPYYTLHRVATADHSFYTYDQSADIHFEFFVTDTASGDVIPDLPITHNLQPNSIFQTGTGVYMRGDTCYRTTGIHATSTTPLTSVFTSRDRYTLKGHNALGTHFLVPAPKNVTRPYRSNYIRSLRTCIEIIATEDHTKVQIDPSADLLCGTPAHTPLNIILQRGQTYYAPAASTDPQHQLGGSIVTSNHPIAVNITADSVRSTNDVHCSTIGEQIVPSRLLGTRYTAQRYGDIDSDNLQITFYPLYDNTRCLFAGDLPSSIVLNRGDDTTFYPQSSTWYFEFDKPVATFVTAYYGGYFGGTMLPRHDCSGSMQAPLYPSTFTRLERYTIYAPDSVRNMFTLSSGDAMPIHTWPRDWNDTTYFFTRLDWQVGQDRLHNPSPFRLTELILRDLDTLCGCTYTILTDYDLDEGYMYFNMDQHYCQGDTVFFKFERGNVEHIQLTGPNGFFNTETDSLYIIADTAYTGWYHLRSTYPTACDSVNDSIFITIHTPLYQELFDTIVENQLPWERFDTTFLSNIDTTIIRSTDLVSCDTTFDYHLTIYRNIYDTIIYYACESDIPVTYEGQELSIEGIYPFEHTGIHGEDSNTYFFLHIIPSTDTTIYDTIVESQLPWYVFDTVFNDTVTDYIYRTYNEAGCDSIVHYHLHIFWNGDHCDSSLTYPNVVTPNGDGLNDRFVIGGLIENNCFKYSDLSIYDRYGTRVYHKRNIASESDWWDPAAHHAPDGTYFFIFRAHGIKIHTMHKGVIEVLSE